MYLIFFCHLCFWCHTQEILAKSNVTKMFPKFPSKSFVISALLCLGIWSILRYLFIIFVYYVYYYIYLFIYYYYLFIMFNICLLFVYYICLYLLYICIYIHIYIYICNEESLVWSHGSHKSSISDFSSRLCIGKLWLTGQIWFTICFSTVQKLRMIL